MSVTWEIREGDCVAAMAGMPESSVDAIVTDPPYGLEFMGKDWDSLGGRQRPYQPRGEGHANGGILPMYGRGGTSEDRDRFKRRANHAAQEWHEAWAREALRVLKPGGHLLAFGGTRTYHRLACAVEDAGFEIRDTIVWLYGSGFPKSLDVSKAIDKAAGAEREVVGRNPTYRDSVAAKATQAKWNGAVLSGTLTAPATSEAQEWEGWGTALKPAHEPIVVARKPLAGNVAANVLAHGTGALNIDGCRIGPEGETWPTSRSYQRRDTGAPSKGTEATGAPPAGRWPANVALDEEAAAMLDGQSGELASGARNGGDRRDDEQAWRFRGGQATADHEGVSRFFYCAKASSAERGNNRHPTVKPVELMRWLVRLVTPPGGLILDPFAGSGTTGIAATRDGFSFVGLEREPEYVAVARERIRNDAPLLNTTSEATPVARMMA